MKATIRAKLVAKQSGVYANYVFEDLNEETSSLGKYVTVTIPPNWQNVREIKVGDCGFLEYDYVSAGESYLQRATNTTNTYKYTANYFMNFIKDTKEDNKEYNF